jgi:hypothetical protein
MTREEREAVVDWFAEQMKAKLREREHKGDWRELRHWEARDLLKVEVEELEEELRRQWSGWLGWGQDFEKTIDECCDVANYALIIAHTGKLCDERRNKDLAEAIVKNKSADEAAGIVGRVYSTQTPGNKYTKPVRLASIADTDSAGKRDKV